MCNTVNTFVVSLKNLLTDKGLSIPPDNSQSARYTLQIPEYQRPYTWTAKQVMQLLDDVVRFSKYSEYRIGTIILHCHDKVLDIVDGQQRIITSLLIATKCLQEDNLASIDIPVHDSSIAHLKNNKQVIDDYIKRSPDKKGILEKFFLSKCTIQVLVLDKLDEAFQLFDSSNNRGKALYPTDLLKAFHLREIEGGEDQKLNMVELWENIDPSHINTLFADYLFRIKLWSKNKSVPDLGFSNADIDIFKGIGESTNTADLPWARTLLRAKKYVDAYNQQAYTMWRAEDRVEMNYGFQIDQPMINGEYFFKFVDYYNKILEKHGFYSDSTPTAEAECASPSDEPTLDSEHLASSADDAVASLYSQVQDKRYFRLVHGLYKTAMLYAIDKFSDKQYKLIEDLCFRYAYYPRFYFAQVKRKSINKFVIDSEAGIDNLFAYINEALSPEELSRFEVSIVRKKLKNANTVEKKAPNIAEKYLGTQGEESGDV